MFLISLSSNLSSFNYYLISFFFSYYFFFLGNDFSYAWFRWNFVNQSLPAISSIVNMTLKFSINSVPSSIRGSVSSACLTPAWNCMLYLLFIYLFIILFVIYLLLFCFADLFVLFLFCLR
jgi:hypothetical protein